MDILGIELNSIIDLIIVQILAYVPSLLFALIVFFVGLWVIKVIKNVFFQMMNKSKVDVALSKFLINFVDILLKLFLAITVLSMLGVEMTSFIAVLAAAGFAVGLALQGSLANFAGGVLILLFKPFRVGDFIESQGLMGTVNEIQVFNTILKTPDNKTVIVPNGPLSNSNITNFSREATRRVDMVFGISYDSDLKKAKKLLEKIVTSDKRVLKDPAPMIVVSDLADSSVNFATRVWVKKEDYWGLFFDMQEKVKLEFDKNKISIPYPQTDVHLYKGK